MLLPMMLDARYPMPAVAVPMNPADAGRVISSQHADILDVLLLGNYP